MFILLAAKPDSPHVLKSIICLMVSLETKVFGPKSLHCSSLGTTPDLLKRVNAADARQ